MVQASTGRLSSPVFPGEALGLWPTGNFQIVRGEVDGAYLALALGLLAAAIGAYAAFRRRDWGLVAVGASAVVVYFGARLFASIYVDAKALAVMSPLVVMAVLLALFAPSWRPGGRRADRAGLGTADRRLSRVRYGIGGVLAAALAGSTFLALRAAPVGFDQRGVELERLASTIESRSVVFFGVDRFAAYWLRDTLVKSPGGNVPVAVKAREKKSWEPGLAIDFDTISSRRLDRFDYAITTRAGYQSAAPPNFTPVDRTASYVLWKREGSTPALGIIDKDGAPGRVLGCPRGPGHGIAGRQGSATVLHPPVIGRPRSWSRESPFDAPAIATQPLRLSPGHWRLSLQYASQVPLQVSVGGHTSTLPPSLDGMYIDRKGQGAFWAAGNFETKGGTETVTVGADQPSALQRSLGVRRQVWLGTVAATRAESKAIPLHDACDRFVDHWRGRG
jgi:hypothetical protein